MVFDIHAHVFPDTIADRAAQSIADFYDIPMNGDGRVSTLLRLGDEAGIDRFLIHSVATTSHHVVSVNQFIASAIQAHPDRFMGFMSMHPDYEDMDGEIERAIELGLRGVKLHPDIQHYALTEQRVYRMFEKFEGRLPALIHAGDRRYHYSNPALIAKLLSDFPRLTVIAAHMGGWSEWDAAAEALAGRFENLYVDTSSTMFAIPPGRMARLVAQFGADRVLFGTDFPMWTPKSELDALNRLPIAESEKELIRWTNANLLLGGCAS